MCCVPLAVAERARFFKLWLRRIAPDTHVDQAGGEKQPVALAAMPPRKNVGTAMRPRGLCKFEGCLYSGANPSVARMAGGPL
ncbi:hypothetical protein QFZ98_004563 [Paraburkholderia youngii]